MTAPNLPPLTLDDAKDPQRLLYYLRQLSARIAAVTPTTTITTSTVSISPSPLLTSQQLDQIQRELSAAGNHSLPVEGLQGRTSQAQRASLIIFPTDPTTTIDANLYDVGTMGTFGGNLYYVAAGNPHTWGTLTLTVAPHNLLSTTHGDALAAAVVRGDIITGNATPKWARLPIGTALQVPRVNAGGTDLEYSAVTDAMLSANVPLKNAANVFTSTNTFATAILGALVRLSLEAAGSTPYTIDGAHFFVGVTHVGATTVKLTAAPAAGDTFVIVDPLGQAAANNITVDGNGHNVDGAATALINVNYGAMRVFYTGGIWKTW